MLTDLATIARRTGYPVVEVPGWKTRGRPGGMLGVRTITCHHTANGGAPGNYPSLRVVRDGRPGLPGPLAQLGLGVDGTVYVIAAGKCNHAGVSRATFYTNSWAVGIEAEAEGVPGDKQDWPPAQWDSYVRLCRALVDAYGLTSTDVRGHKETCSPAGRKSDPSFDMGKLRAAVRTLSPLKLPTKEATAVTETINLDDSKQVLPHKLTDADVRAFGGKVGTPTSWSSLLRFPPAVARLRSEVAEYVRVIREDIAATRSDVAEARAEVARLHEHIDQLVAALALPPKE